MTKFFLFYLIFLSSCSSESESQPQFIHPYDANLSWQYFRVLSQDGVMLPRYDGVQVGQNESLTLQWQLDSRIYSHVGIIPVVNRIDMATGWYQTMAGPTRTYTLVAEKRLGGSDVPFAPIRVPTVLVGGYPTIFISGQPPEVCPNEVVRISWQARGCSRVVMYGGNREDRWDCQLGPMETTVAVPQTTTFSFQLRDSEEQPLPGGWAQVQVPVKSCP